MQKSKCFLFCLYVATIFFLTSQTWYHVVFFDDMDRPRTRAWVQVERLQNFESRPIDEDVSNVYEVHFIIASISCLNVVFTS